MKLNACLLALLAAAPYFAHAEETDAAAQLPDIVVTGERGSRTVFQTGTSHNVFTAPDIDRSGHKLSATDLLKQTVNTVDLGSGNDLPTVRGVDGSGPAVGAVAFFAGTRPRLNLSIDGRSATYNEYAFGTQSLWDTPVTTTTASTCPCPCTRKACPLPCAATKCSGSPYCTTAPKAAA